MSIYKNFSSRKAKWKRKVRRCDISVLHFINQIKRGDANVALMDYKEMGAKILYLGEAGEKLIKEAVELGMYDRVIYEMRDMLNFVGDLSTRMKSLTERKWGGKIRSYPLYEPTVEPAIELQKQAESVRQLDRLVESKKR